MKKARKPRKPLNETPEQPAETVGEVSGNDEVVSTEASEPDSEQVLQRVASGDRVEEREQVDLKAIIQVKDLSETWKETTVVHSVSRAGAGINVSRRCTVGRLVTLVLPMPLELRAYDHHERLYPVMGLVQYCHEITIDGQTSYNLGVAFIGKRVPDSYSVDTLQNYRLSGMDSNGLWRVAEVRESFQVRKHSRFWVEVEVSVTVLQQDKKAVCKDVTKTQDISAGGAAIRSAVEAKIGDKVKFTCKKYNFFSMAVVRNRTADGGDEPTIHLEFLDRKFPVHLVPKPELDGISAGQMGISKQKPADFAVERF